MSLTKAFAQICLLINEHFRADDIAEWRKGSEQIYISELLGQMVDE